MAMSVYSLAPLIGPSVGPLVGGWYAIIFCLVTLPLQFN